MLNTYIYLNDKNQIKITQSTLPLIPPHNPLSRHLNIKRKPQTLHNGLNLNLFHTILLHFLQNRHKNPKIHRFSELPLALLSLIYNFLGSKPAKYPNKAPTILPALA